MSSQQLKVIFKNETKKFRKPADFEVLVHQTVKAFGTALPKNFKFFYQDSDGDLISISCQDDLEEAYASMQHLRLFVEASIEQARQSIEPDFSMRSSLNMPFNREQSLQDFQSQSSKFNPRGISVDFEEIKQEDKHSQSVGVGEEEMIKQGKNTSTDAADLINVQSTGINTQTVNTDEKQLNAVVETNEFGSQMMKDVKDVQCDGSIQTESKGSQFKTEAISQEINCQIIRPEKEEECIQEEAIVCFKCDGTKVNKKGLPCRRCNGSGTLTSKFFSEVVKVLKEEIRSYTTQTFQRLLVDYLGKKAADQQAQVHAHVTCDACNTSPITGIRYKCSVCNDFDLCEKCEAEQNHPHPMLKIRRADQAPALIQCSFNYQSQEVNLNQSQRMNQSSAQSARSNKKQPEKKTIIYSARFVKENFGDRYVVFPNQKFLKSWTFRNNGETDWPADTLFIQTNGDQFGAPTYIVDRIVKPGDEIQISMEMTAPSQTGKYCAFFRFVYGDNHRFGQKVWCDILVQEEPKNVTPVSVKEQEQVSSGSQKEEKSSLLNESDNLYQSQAEEEKQPVDIENLAQQYEKLAEQVAQPEDSREQLKKTINNLMNSFDEPAANLNKSQDLLDQVSHNSGPMMNKQNLMQSVFEEEPVEDKQCGEFEQPALSQEEIDKINYMRELENAKIKDQILIENLKYMLELGYSNFQVNYNLLKRNNNDITIAINLLCNGIVSDSMFGQQ